MLCTTRSDRAASVCYLAVYKSSDWDVFFYLLGGTERHTETFQHCTKQKSIEIIPKSKDQAPNKVSAHSFEWFVFPHGVNRYDVFVAVPSNADQVYTLKNPAFIWSW